MCRAFGGLMKRHGNRLCIVGLAGAVIFLALGFVWEVRARALLAMDGHLFVRLADPTNAPALEKKPRPFFAAKAVFKNDQCIGFLDTGGHFVKVGAAGPNMHKILWYTWVDYVLFSISGIVFLIGLVSLLFGYIEGSL